LEDKRRLLYRLRQRRAEREYQSDPAKYIHDVLKQQMWQAQTDICTLLMKPPHKVMVKASHSIGKTWLCAALFKDSAMQHSGPGSRWMTDACVIGREARPASPSSRE
jgi:hypothetical protein